MHDYFVGKMIFLRYICSQYNYFIVKNVFHGDT